MESNKNTYTNKTNTGDLGTVCKKCYKPFVYIGDVPMDGWLEGCEPYCTCNQKKQTTGLQGWICPVCGAGLSPYTTMCPCKNMNSFTITSKTVL
jgi:hypothetical protein